MTSVDEQAAAFWRRVGDPPSFPRDLEAAILWGLPLAIVKLPRLRAGAVDDWFRRRGRGHRVEGTDRALRACLIAFRGRGVIFLDAADAAAEFRFSLAHEAAHFIVDYLVPRERVLGRMGRRYEAILDGERRARPDELIDGLLAGVALGIHRHLMDRGPAAEERVSRSEARADRLALELLAPRAEVARMAHGRGALDAVQVEAVLVDHFGLPQTAARGYALTFGPSTPVVSLRSWLGRGVELPAANRNMPREE